MVRQIFNDERQMLFDAFWCNHVPVIILDSGLFQGNKDGTAVDLHGDIEGVGMKMIMLVQGQIYHWETFANLVLV